MADINKTIEIIFGAVDNTSGAFTKVGNGLQHMEDSIGSITGPLASVTDTLIKTELAIAAVGAAFLAVSFNSAVAFDSALVDLAKQLDGGVDEANSYEKAIFDLSQEFGVSATEITQAFAEFAQAGFETDDAFSLVVATIKQTKVSELEAAEAAELLKRILKGLGAEAGDVNRILDLINQTTNSYSLNQGQLSEAIARTAQIATGAKFSIEDLIGVLTPMIEVTQSAEVSSTAFNTTMQRMTSLNSEVAKGYEILGIKQEDFNGDIKSGSALLKEAQGAFTGLSDGQKGLVVQYLAGQDQAAKFRVVLEQGNRTLEITNEALKGVGTSLEKELAIKMKAAGVQIDRTKVSFDNLSIAIGKKLKIELAGVTDSTGDLARAFRELVEKDKFKPLFDVLTIALKDFEGDLRLIAKALPEAFKGVDFVPLTDGFDKLGDAISEIFDGVDLTTPEGLRDAINGIIKVGGSLITVTAGIVDGITPVLKLIGGTVEAFSKLSPDVQLAIGALLGFSKGINILLPVVGALGTGLSTLGGGLQIIGSAKNIGAVTKLSGAFGELAASLGPKAGLVGAAAAAGIAIGTLWNKLFELAVPGETFGTWLHSVSTSGDDAEKALGKMSFTAADFADKLKEQNVVVDEAAIKIKGLIGPVEAAKLGEEALKQSIEKVNDTAKIQTEGVSFLTKEFVAAGNSIGDYNSVLATTEKSHGTLVKTTIDAKTGLKTYSQTVDLTAESLDKQTEKTKIVKEETDQFRISMEKIASDERIKNIEAKISLDIANVEANAKIVTSAFESIDTGIESTGKLIGDLFGVLLDANSWAQKRLIETQLEKENKRRDQEFKLQKQLTEAEINLIKEKTKRLAKGDALIKINGDGLAPQLEAFMWEVLNAIQVRANAEGSEFLLGVA